MPKIEAGEVYDHDWRYTGRDRGDILVDCWECQRCGMVRQRAVADDPDIPPELRNWEAWSDDGIAYFDDRDMSDCKEV